MHDVLAQNFDSLSVKKWKCLNKFQYVLSAYENWVMSNLNNILLTQYIRIGPKIKTLM